MVYSNTNISVLNNYNYENKPTVVNYLDLVSSPWREVCGGKSICLITQQMETSKKPLLLKIAIIALLILVLPKVGCVVAALSLSALAIKMMILKQSPEFEKITHQIKKTDVLKEFEAAKEKKFHNEVIEIFQKHSFLREIPEVQTTYAISVVEQFRWHSISLKDVARSFSFINNENLLIVAIKNLITVYFKNHHGNVFFQTLELQEVITIAFGEGLQKEVTEKVCRAILESCKIDKEIDMNHCFLWDLFQILVIEDTLSLLEKVNNNEQIQNLRKEKFATITNYEASKIEDIRMFLQVTHDLNAATTLLKKSLKKKNVEATQQALNRLSDLAMTMKFKYITKSLRDNMVDLLNNRIEKKKTDDQIKELEWYIQTACGQIEAGSNMNFQLATVRQFTEGRGFILKRYLQREHLRFKECFNEAMAILIPKD